MNKKGFTLLELLTVVIIIGILTSFALPQYQKVIEKSRFTKAQIMMKALMESRDRLVAEFGYDDYRALRAANNSITPLRFDMFSAEALPVNHTVTGQQVVGPEYTYSAIAGPAASDLVGAKITIGKYQGVYFLFDGRTFLCNDNAYQAGGDKPCDVFNLDRTTVEVGF